MATTTDNNQDQNAIDNLNSHLTQAGEHIANNKKIIYWALGVIVAVAAICAGWLWGYKIPNAKNSQAALDQVMLKAEGNDSIASTEYAKVADKYGSTNAGNLASLHAAISYFNIGKYAECVKYLEKFSSKDDVMAAQAKVLLGDANVNLKKYDAAISAYNAALRLSAGNEQIAPVVLWKEANIYDAQKKYKNALDCYKQIKDNYPTFSFGNGISVDAYIAREEARLDK